MSERAVMNVAISQLVEDFDTTVTTIQAVIALYALTMAALMLKEAGRGRQHPHPAAQGRRPAAGRRPRRRTGVSDRVQVELSAGGSFVAAEAGEPPPPAEPTSIA